MKNQKGFGLVGLLIALLVGFAVYYFAMKGKTAKENEGTAKQTDPLANPAPNQQTIRAVESKLDQLTKEQNDKVNKVLDAEVLEHKQEGK